MKKSFMLGSFSLLICVLANTSCTQNNPTANIKEKNEIKNETQKETISNTIVNDKNNDLVKYITKGLAKTEIKNFLPCSGSRISGVGSILSSDGKEWTVPSKTNFLTANKASDLYNDCNNVRPESINQVNLTSIPVIEVDSNGEEITAFIFADNYFEFYVNGKLVAVDPVPFTPFNSSVVKFKAKRPITYAFKLVDWEENLGQGTENNQGNSYHAGDGGFIAKFSDGTVTNNKWKAQSFYIAPLQDANCVKESTDGKHDSSSCETKINCGTNCQSIHYNIPDNWFLPYFDDSKWLKTSIYTENEIGVDNKPAYMNFKPQFSGAEFIWSSNLILDNEVLIRYTTEK